MSNNPVFPVRTATLREAKIIADIYSVASAVVLKDLVSADALASLCADYDLAFWRDAIEYGEPQVHVATEDGRVVGFVGFDRSRDKGTAPTMGEIWFICVTPACWSKGVGLALWDAAREGLIEEGCTHVTVWVPLGNDRAMRFHELAGFKREMSSAKTVPLSDGRIEEIRLKRALT
jgi:ribosomal protein S18 acetylase RimI-like enzyme